MKKLLDYENPLFQFLSRVGDLMMLNVLFLVCCVPVVTIGAAVTAMCRVDQGYVTGREPGMFKTFFHSFKTNFKQATIAWLILALVLACLVCDILIINGYLTGTAARVLRLVIIGFIVIVLAVASYLFPLLARYENTLRQHLQNAAILSIGKLPRTVVMVVLNALPVIIFLLSVTTFFKTLAFWVIIGFSVMNFLDCYLLRPVLAELEKPKDQPEQEEADETDEDEAE